MLFREEAVRSRAGSVFGSIVVGSSRLSTLLTIFAILLALAVVLLFALGTYARKERAAGYLVPDTGLVKIMAPRAGVLARVDVAEGQSVAVDDPLILISASRDSATGTDPDQIRVDRLREEQAVIEAQMADERELASAQLNDAEHRLADAGARLRSAKDQRKEALTRVELLNHDGRRLVSLHKDGYVPSAQVEGKRIEILDAGQDTHFLNREIRRIEGEIAELQSELIQIPLRRDVRLNELRSRLFIVQRNLAEAEARQSTLVRAPVAGRVTAVTVHPGMSVTPERTLLSIVPHNAKMRAELLVPTRAAGFVRTGQRVRLRYDAYPYQKFGLYGGTIESVSRTVLNPEDQHGPVRLRAPAYRVVAILDSQTVTAYGSPVPLQAGLTLQADIVRDRRRIIEWLFDPVIAAVKGI